jgi:hypothetical protein
MLALFAQTSSTELNKTSGMVLDMALEGPVRVVHRSQNFVLIREDVLEDMLESA